MTRRTTTVVLAAGALSLLGPSTSVAAPTAKAEAKRLLAPMRSFERSTRPQRPQVRAALGAWQEKTTPCVATAKQDLAAAPDPSEENTTGRTLILFVHTLTDGFKNAYAPVDAALATAQRKWKGMALRNARLRLLARWQADGLRFARGLALQDTCAFYAEWKATGFDPQRIPASTRELLEQGETFATPAVDRALRTLRGLVGKRLGDRFELFPLAPTLASEAELTAPLERAFG
jgi:hypothetical protein